MQLLLGTNRNPHSDPIGQICKAAFYNFFNERVKKYAVHSVSSSIPQCGNSGGCVPLLSIICEYSNVAFFIEFVLALAVTLRHEYHKY